MSLQATVPDVFYYSAGSLAPQGHKLWARNDCLLIVNFCYCIDSLLKLEQSGQ
jgi:hypothetical protein